MYHKVKLQLVTCHHGWATVFVVTIHKCVMLQIVLFVWFVTALRKCSPTEQESGNNHSFVWVHTLSGGGWVKVFFMKKYIFMLNPPFLWVPKHGQIPAVKGEPFLSRKKPQRSSHSFWDSNISHALTFHITRI